MLNNEPYYINIFPDEFKMKSLNEMPVNRADIIKRFSEGIVKQFVMNCGKMLLLNEYAEFSLNVHWSTEIANLIMHTWKSEYSLSDSSYKEKMKKAMKSGIDIGFPKIMDNEHLNKFSNFFLTAMKDEIKNARTEKNNPLYKHAEKLSKKNKNYFKQMVEDNYQLMHKTINEIIDSLILVGNKVEEEACIKNISRTMCALLGVVK